MGLSFFDHQIEQLAARLGMKKDPDAMQGSVSPDEVRMREHMRRVKEKMMAPCTPDDYGRKYPADRYDYGIDKACEEEKESWPYDYGTKQKKEAKTAKKEDLALCSKHLWTR